MPQKLLQSQSTSEIEENNKYNNDFRVQEQVNSAVSIAQHELNVNYT